MAKRIQQMWRLRAARVEFGNRLAEAAQKELRRNRAATKIQGIHRKRMSRKRIKLLLAQRAKQRLEDALSWQETWSEDGEKWFYINAETQEAVWEPPKCGYTKNDGTRVLVAHVSHVAAEKRSFGRFLL